MSLISNKNQSITSSRAKYESLSCNEWRKVWFCESSGGFIASHVVKAADDLSRSGIVAEANGCRTLAEMGKHVLRLPENIPNLIDSVIVEGRPYRELLKYKRGEYKPRGYPDVYFDGQTWDFKETSTDNIDTIRQLIKDGKKADNVIFVGASSEEIKMILIAMERELGRELKNGTWLELPNLYCLNQCKLFKIWMK